MSRRPAIGFALALLAIDALGMGLIIPITPMLVRTLSGGEASRAALWVGTLSASFNAAQFLAAPVLGGLSDRFGRRPVMLISIGGMATNYLLLAWAPSLVWLFLGQCLAGMSAANVSATTAYIADLTPPERRGASFSLVSAMFGLGFVLGPALGGVLGGFGLRVPFLAAALLAFGNAMYGLFVIPESLPQAHRRRFSWRRVTPFGALGVLRGGAGGSRLAVAWCSAWFGLGALQSAFVLGNTLRFGWGTAQNGTALALSGLTQALVQLVLIRRLITRIGERRAVGIGCLFGVAAHGIFAFAAQGWMIYAGVAVLALGGFTIPGLRALFSMRVEADRQGEMQGALAALQSLTAIASPLVGAALFAHFTTPGTVPFFPGAPFVMAMGSNLLALAALRVPHHIPAEAAGEHR